MLAFHRTGWPGLPYQRKHTRDRHAQPRWPLCCAAMGATPKHTVRNSFSLNVIKLIQTTRTMLQMWRNLSAFRPHSQQPVAFSVWLRSSVGTQHLSLLPSAYGALWTQLPQPGFPRQGQAQSSIAQEPKEPGESAAEQVRHPGEGTRLSRHVGPPRHHQQTCSPSTTSHSTETPNSSRSWETTSFQQPRWDSSSSSPISLSLGQDH